MAAPLTRRPRVLLGNLEPMVRLGMNSALAEDGIEVVGEAADPSYIVREVRRLRPDAVVLGLDSGSSRAVGEEVRVALPTAKVILWARDEDVMQVLDPGFAEPREIRTEVREGLRLELSNCQTPQAVEE